MWDALLPFFIVLVVIGILFTALPLFTPDNRIAGNQFVINLGPPATDPPQKILSIILTQSSIDFGGMDIGEARDTLGFSPSPFVLENNGKIAADVEMYADDLWDSTANPSVFYQFLTAESEPGSVVDPLTDLVTTFTDIPPEGSNVAAIENFKSQNPNDEVFIHLRVEVPTGEMTGDKESVVTFKASAAGFVVASSSLRLPPTSEASLSSDTPDNSLGSDSFIQIGTGSSEYGLISFDLSRLPQGADIHKVRLVLFQYDATPFPGSLDLDIHATTSEWDETVTWNTRPTFEPDILASTSVGHDHVRNHVWDITTPVRTGTSSFLIKRSVEDGEVALARFRAVEPLKPAEELVAAYSFDENQGQTIFDLTGNGHDLTVPGNDDSNWGQGRFETAGNTDGNGVLVAEASSLLDNLFAEGGAVSAWINPRTLEDGVIVGKMDEQKAVGWIFRIKDSALSFVHKYDGGQGEWSAGTIETGSWQHVAVVIDAQIPLFYLNGGALPLTQVHIPEGSVLDDSVGQLTVGNSLSGEAGFDGLIDNARLYTVALTEQEIAEDKILPTGNIPFLEVTYSEEVSLLASSSVSRTLPEAIALLRAG